jgi:HAD superfamily hydrolase (TIGR01509 family)
MTRVLLWDVMDTVVRDPFRGAMPEYLGITFDAMLREKHPTAWVDFETGLIDEDQFGARFYADGRGIDAAGMLRHIRPHYRFIEGIEPLLGDLRAHGVAMHVLSNYPCWYRAIEEETGLSRYVPWTFVSCHTGLRKPDPRCYLHVLRSLGVGASDCVLIDDRGANCEGARAVGMQALCFEGDPARLREGLALLGVP